MVSQISVGRAFLRIFSLRNGHFHISIDLVNHCDSRTPRPTELSKERVVLNCIKADNGGAV